MRDLSEVKQKMLILQELGLKASMAGLCKFECRFDPVMQSFYFSAQHSNTVNFKDVINVHFFLDHIRDDFYDTDQQLFVLDSALSFFQGLLDSNYILSTSISEVQQEAA